MFSLSYKNPSFTPIQTTGKLSVPHGVTPLKLATLLSKPPVTNGRTFREPTNSCDIILLHKFATCLSRILASFTFGAMPSVEVSTLCWSTLRDAHFLCHIVQGSKYSFISRTDFCPLCLHIFSETWTIHRNFPVATNHYSISSPYPFTGL